MDSVALGPVANLLTAANSISNDDGAFVRSPYGG
jgi:hypothetical protein